MKKACVLLAVILFLCSVFFSHNLMNAMAEEPVSAFNKYYTSIRIDEGDNLWSIAKTYNHNSGMTTSEYIKELKSMNRLKDDKIHAGNYLTIVYFSEAPLE